MYSNSNNQYGIFKSQKSDLLAQFTVLYRKNRFREDADAMDEFSVLLATNQDQLDADKNNALHYLVLAVLQVGYDKNAHLTHHFINKYKTLLAVPNKEGYTPFQLTYVKLIKYGVIFNIDFIYYLWVQVGTLSQLNSLAPQSTVFITLLNDLFLLALKNKRFDLLEQLTNQQYFDLATEQSLQWGLIWKLVYEENTELLTQLFDIGFNVNAMDVNKPTSIVCEAMRGSTSILAWLLSRGASLTTPDSYGCSPLHRVSSIEKLEILLSGSSGIDLNIGIINKNYQAWEARVGNTPLAEAIIHARTDIAKALITHGASITNIDASGNALIHLSAQFGNLDLMKYAVSELTQSIYLQNAKGENVIESVFNQMIEYKKCHLSTFSYIFSLDEFNPNLCNAQGNSILMQLHKYNHVHAESKPFITMMYKHFSNQINRPNANQDTPLHRVAEQGRNDEFQQLLDLGADINAVNHLNETPILLFKSKFCYLKEEQLLQWMDKITDFNCAGSEGMTLLHWCAMYGLTKCIQKLIRKGAQLGIEDKNHCNAAFYALAYGKLDAYFLLKDAGFNVKPSMLVGNELHDAAKCKYDLINASKNKDKVHAIEVCLNAILFTRWSDDSDFEHYRQSINLLINKYG
ncbi:MAG: ankyrin repeat domain-containing protein, partial [Legionella sp.]